MADTYLVGGHTSPCRPPAKRQGLMLRPEQVLPDIDDATGAEGVDMSMVDVVNCCCEDGPSGYPFRLNTVWWPRPVWGRRANETRWVKGYR